MEFTSLMIIPAEFKIKKKRDVRLFLKECMVKGSTYFLSVNREYAIWMTKDEDGNIVVAYKQGDLSDVFNPIIRVGSCTELADNPYINDYLWQFRKYINRKWFN